MISPNCKHIKDILSLETDLFISLSQAINNVRNRDDLKKLLETKLRELFTFQNAMVLILHSDPKRNTRVYSAGLNYPPDTFPFDSALDVRKTENNCLQGILQAERVLVFDMEELMSMSECPPDVVFEYQQGIREKIVIPLKEEDQQIGVFCINSKLSGAYSKHDLTLMKGISYQLSTTIANMIAHEDIQRRENEREVLLTLSTEMASIRNSGDLLQVVKARFKSILGFDESFIYKLNEDNQTTSPLVYTNWGNRLLADCAPAGDLPLSIREGLFGEASMHSEPIYTYLHDTSKQRHLPINVSLIDRDWLQAVTIRIAKGGAQCGFWILFFRQPFPETASTTDLIKGLANQLSVVLVNIAANREIEAREEEKTRLLAFSNAIASVRDKPKLGKLIKEQLKALFKIDSYVIHILNSEKTKHRPILFDPASPFADHPDFKKLMDTETTVNDGIFDKIIDADGPVFFNLGDWTQLPQMPVYVNAARAVNVTSLIGVAIRLGHETIGVMNFRHNDFHTIMSQRKLFDSILSQLAITLANVAANEKITKQLAEINCYKQQLEEEKIYLKEELAISHHFSEIIGESPAIQRIFRMIGQVAAADSTVLIMGETGTGKELVARAIHNNSPRKNKLMVKVNCAALPANLIESELFGHERGSFTGATDRRLGKFELANGGTLFLDEIGEMPLDLQVKLLRALQEREIERIGGRGTIKVDVRIIAATNRDLEKEMEEKRFRSDLYYRLNIFPITLPPLRERPSDIPLLAKYFINRFSKKTARKIAVVSNRAMQEIMQYSWPGNIRELEHLIERSILLSEGETLNHIHLPQSGKISKPNPKSEFLVRSLEEVEKEHIMSTIRYSRGRIGGRLGAAELLGMPSATLFSKMKKLGLKREVVSLKS